MGRNKIESAATVRRRRVKTAIKKAARLATNRLFNQLKPLELNGLRGQTQLSSAQLIFS
jgi:hypothetical protein